MFLFVLSYIFVETCSCRQVIGLESKIAGLMPGQFLFLKCIHVSLHTFHWFVPYDIMQRSLSVFDRTF